MKYKRKNAYYKKDIFVKSSSNSLEMEDIIFYFVCLLSHSSKKSFSFLRVLLDWLLPLLYRNHQKHGTREYISLINLSISLFIRQLRKSS